MRRPVSTARASRSGSSSRTSCRSRIASPGLAAVDATRAASVEAARLWGSVVGFEQTSGTPLNERERQRYERVLGELERGTDTPTEFAEGTAMTLDDAVEYALASVE